MNKRCFGGGHGHGPAPKAPNGLAPILQHLDGSHEHHHDHVHAADLNHKFIAENVNKKYLVFTGLKGRENVEVGIDN